MIINALFYYILIFLFLKIKKLNITYCSKQKIYCLSDQIEPEYASVMLVKGKHVFVQDII